MTKTHLSRNLRKHTFWNVRPLKTQTCLIRVVVVLMIYNLCILSYPKCAQWRFWSDCANAQADLNLQWAYISEGTFFWHRGSFCSYQKLFTPFVSTFRSIVFVPTMPTHRISTEKWRDQWEAWEVDTSDITRVEISNCFLLSPLLHHILGHHSESFSWSFILNENLLFLFIISYQKPSVFSISVFCYQIFTLKLNLQPKIRLTNAMSIVVIHLFFFFFFFFFFCQRKYFLDGFFKTSGRAGVRWASGVVPGLPFS